MIPTARRSHHQPPHRRLLFLSKTAPFSFSVAFFTPPTFPTPAPRKRFFDPLPKKILGFRTRKGRLPRRQYLARARLEFRAGLRGVVSSRARAFGISCGLLACVAGGWLAALAADGSRWRCACAPARHGIPARARLVSPAPARLAALADGLPSCRLQELAADLPTVCPPCRHAAPIGAAPDRLPPVCRSAAATACRAGLPICRRAGRSRRRGYLPRPVSSPDKLS